MPPNSRSPWRYPQTYSFAKRKDSPFKELPSYWKDIIAEDIDRTIKEHKEGKLGNGRYNAKLRFNSYLKSYPELINNRKFVKACNLISNISYNSKSISKIYKIDPEIIKTCKLYLYWYNIGSYDKNKALRDGSVRNLKKWLKEEPALRNEPNFIKIYNFLSETSLESRTKSKTKSKTKSVTPNSGSFSVNKNRKRSQCTGLSLDKCNAKQKCTVVNGKTKKYCRLKPKKQTKKN